MIITIKGELCDFNTFQNATRMNKFVGSKIKKEQTELVYWACKEQKAKEVKVYPHIIIYKWFSKDNRKDIDNVAFAKKFINDGLVMAGVLKGDGRKFINGFMDEFYIDAKNPRVEISL
jgi:hypothetical protein